MSNTSPNQSTSPEMPAAFLMFGDASFGKLNIADNITGGLPLLAGKVSAGEANITGNQTGAADGKIVALGADEEQRLVDMILKALRNEAPAERMPAAEDAGRDLLSHDPAIKQRGAAAILAITKELGRAALREAVHAAIEKLSGMR